jgi:hypothetical protein
VLATCADRAFDNTCQETKHQEKKIKGSNELK